MRFALFLALVGCSGASLGDGPADRAAPDAAAAEPDAAPVAEPDAGEPACANPVTYFLDGDDDGYGDPNAAVDACEPPAGYVTDATDCDDGNRDVHPAALELCGDAIDNDCSGDDACALARIAVWSFDDAVGLADASGNGHLGLGRGGVTVVANAAVFDGNNDYVEVPHDASFARAEGTIALWIDADDLTAPHGLWSRDSSGLDGGGHLTLWTTDAGAVRMRLQSATESHEIIAGALTTGAAHHVVASFGPAGMALYVDGALVGTNGYTGGTTGNVEPIVMGISNHASDDASATPIRDPFDGRMHDARMYGRALSATEIGQLYALTAP